MTTVRILLVAALTILGMAVITLGLVPAVPEQAPQAAAAALLAVAVAVVLVLGALVRDLAGVPEEVQALEALVRQAEVQRAQAAEQASLHQAKEEQKEEFRHQEVVRAEVQARNQVLLAVAKTQPQPREVNQKALPLRVAGLAAVAKSKRTGKKK